MIISKTVKIDDKNYTKTYSDAGYYIERNGIRYEEAIDPLGSGREYTETDILIQTDPDTVESAVKKLKVQTEKNTSDIEYIAMMTETDLEV